MIRCANAIIFGVLVSCLCLAGCSSTSTQISVAATTTVPTATLPSVGLHPQADWTPSTTLDAFAKDVQFALSAPATGYACGMTAPNSTVQFAATQDGGVTWQTTPLAFIDGVNCGISISPTVPTDLLLELTGCAPPTLDCNYVFPLYRSRDGGQHWSLLSPPISNGGIFGQTIWAGDDLYILTNAKMPLTQRLAVSVAGGSIHWIDLTSLYAHLPPGSSMPTNAFVLGNTLSLVFTPSGCPCLIARTTDGGANWTIIAPQGNMVDSITTSQDGKTLLGVKQDQRTYYSSADGGVTWMALPALPSDSDAFDLLEYGPTASDGTIYTMQQVLQPQAAGSGALHMLKLAPGATTWTLIAAKDTLYTLLSVSSDAQGHPLALWGGRPWTKAVTSQPGIAYRAP